MYVGPVEQQPIIGTTVHSRQLRGIGKSCAVFCAGGLKSAGKTADKGPLSSKAFQVRALLLLTAAVPLAVAHSPEPAIVHQWKCRPLQNNPSRRWHSATGHAGVAVDGALEAERVRQHGQHPVHGLRHGRSRQPASAQRAAQQPAAAIVVLAAGVACCICGTATPCSAAGSSIGIDVAIIGAARIAN